MKPLHGKEEMVSLVEEVGTKQDNEDGTGKPQESPSRVKMRVWLVLLLALVLVATTYFFNHNVTDAQEKSTWNKPIQESSNTAGVSHNSAFTNSTVLKLRAQPTQLDELISPRGQIIANVEWLLDFAIVGFPKCGTSNTKRWLNASQSVYMDDFEIRNMATNKPYKVVEHFYNKIVSTRGNNVAKYGMKFPGDIDSVHSLHNFQTFFPNTRFMVMLRHPILWFQSFYNFRHRNIQTKKINDNETQLLRGFRTRTKTTTLGPPNSLIGSCWRNHDEIGYSCINDWRCLPGKVCTHRARFHHAISRLGLTPMNTTDELNLLDHHNMTIVPTKHNQPVMFVELSQYKDSNKERRELLRRHVQDFIGIEDLPPLPPNKVMYEKVEGEIDICKEEYAPVRKVLLRHAQRSSQWIRDYLLQSNRVIVSSREYFLQVLETWNVDPCDVD